MNNSERIEDLLVGAVEGGSTYWAARLTSKAPKGVDFYKGLMQYGMTLWTSDEGDGEEEFAVSPEDFANAINIMREKYPRHYADFVKEQDDAFTADVWFQCAVLKEVVYG